MAENRLSSGLNHHFAIGVAAFSGGAFLRSEGAEFAAMGGAEIAGQDMIGVGKFFPHKLGKIEKT